MLRSIALAAVSAVLIGAVASQAPAQQQSTPEEQEARAAYFRLWLLNDGEVLKRIATPFPAHRALALRDIQQRERLDKPPEAIYVRVQANGRGQGQTSTLQSGRGTMTELLHRLLDRQEEEIEADPEILKLPISGDWIVREDAPAEVVLAQLEELLQQECKAPVKFSIEELERKVVVARGKYRGPEVGGLIYVSRSPINRPYAGSGQGGLDKFLLAVGRHLNCRIVNQVESPPDLYVTWRYDKRPGKDAEQAEKDRYKGAVLKHLSEQIGVTFHDEAAKVPILKVMRAGSASK
jgi:hypothetical protein